MAGSTRARDATYEVQKNQGHGKKNTSRKRGKIHKFIVSSGELLSNSPTEPFIPHFHWHIQAIAVWVLFHWPLTRLSLEPNAETGLKTTASCLGPSRARDGANDVLIACAINWYTARTVAQHHTLCVTSGTQLCFCRRKTTWCFLSCNGLPYQRGDDTTLMCQWKRGVCVLGRCADFPRTGTL